MLDLSFIPDSVLIARGKYSTIRAEHEDEKKNLQILCGALSSLSAQVLRRMQPDSNDAPQSASDLIDACRATLVKMELTAKNIESLAMQRADIRPVAWPK